MDVIVEIDEFTADVPVPEDAIDGVDATTVAQGLQALANRTLYLQNRQGPLYLVNVFSENLAGYDLIHSNNSDAAWGTDDYNIRAGGWDVLTNDVFEFTFGCSVVADGAGVQEYTIGYKIGLAGSPAQLGGLVARYDALSTDAVPLLISSSLVIPGDGVLRLYLQSRTSSVQEGFAYGPWRFTGRLWRPTT